MKLTLVLLFSSLAHIIHAQLPIVPHKRLTNVVDCYPMISPDGKSVVFQSNRTGSWEIFTMQANGSDLKQLTDNTVPDVTPCWSPDGKIIVFASGMDNTSDIFLMNADGSGRKALTAAEGDDSHPHFSADGRQIIFNSARTTPDLSAEWSKQWHEIFIMDSDGTNLKQLTFLKTVCTFPNLSPEGTKMVFRKIIYEQGFNWDLTTAKRNSEIFVMDTNGGNEINISANAAFDGWPCWSPDGRKIVFASNRSGPAGTGQLYMYDLKTKHVVQLTSGLSGHVQSSFSKDGQSMVCYQVFETPGYEVGGIVFFDIVDSH